MTITGAEAATLTAIDHLLWPRSYGGKVAITAAQVFALIGLTVGTTFVIDRFLERLNLKFSKSLALGSAVYTSKFTKKIITNFFKHQMKGVVKEAAKDGRGRLETQIDEQIGESAGPSDPEDNETISTKTQILKGFRSVLRPRSKAGRAAFTVAECLFLVGLAILFEQGVQRSASTWRQKLMVLTGAHLAGLMLSIARSIIRHRLREGLEEIDDALRASVQQRLEELDHQRAEVAGPEVQAPLA